jgi:phosphoglycolate phosphatase-like HAD superfamily hydrolase
MAVHRGPLTVLTNKPLTPTLRILDMLGLTGFFAEIIGGDGPYPRKPDPTALRGLMSTASAQTTVVIGDSPADYKTAGAAGCLFAFARYGFGAGRFGTDPPATPYILDHARDLSSVLDRVRVAPG